MIINVNSDKDVQEHVSAHVRNIIKYYTENIKQFLSRYGVFCLEFLGGKNRQKLDCCLLKQQSFIISLMFANEFQSEWTLLSATNDIIYQSRLKTQKKLEALQRKSDFFMGRTFFRNQAKPLWVRIIHIYNNNIKYILQWMHRKCIVMRVNAVYLNFTANLYDFVFCGQIYFRLGQTFAQEI